MIYIVAGHPRSGTSMMMYALKQAGMALFYSLEREALLMDLVKDKPVHPNPNGFYEISNIQNMERVAEVLEGRLAKVWPRNFPFLPEASYKVIWMLRSTPAIRNSVALAFEKMLGTIATNPYEAQLKKLERVSSERPDMNILPVYYDDVVERPHQEFARIVNFLGVPLDVTAAAKTVEPKLRSF